MEKQEIQRNPKTGLPIAFWKAGDIFPIPDNWEHNKLLNVPLDTLRKHVNKALRRHHPVCWESRGHAMAVVGMARDEEKHAYYVMKNSWGTEQPYGGLVYMPVRRMWKDVVAVYMTREAWEHGSRSDVSSLVK